MMEKRIQNSLLRFLNNSALASDLEVLNDWVKIPSNKKLFEEYIETHYATTIGMSKADPSEIRRQLLEKIRKEKNVFYRLRVKSILRYAAVAIFFLATGYIIQTTLTQFSTERISLPKEEHITLELDNGNLEFLDEDGSTKIVASNGKVVGKQKGGQLIYSDDNEITEVTYNTLSVPYGKQFSLSLSDGTEVHLNAGTLIRYPVKFLPGMHRQVYLKGEAYFDVAEDKNNPFIVSAHELNVRVLGTEFNVTAYPESSDTEVVLIEGSVGLYEHKGGNDIDKDTVLEPGFKGSFNKESKTIEINKVNTTLYTSWMDGRIVFRNEPFDNILKNLERQYNVTIINNNNVLGKESFNAVIEIDKESLEEVLNYFNKVYDIEYQVVNNKVIIN